MREAIAQYGRRSSSCPVFPSAQQSPEPRSRKPGTRPKRYRTSEAIEIKPDFVDAHRNLGFALLHRRPGGMKSMREFKKAIELRPNSVEPHQHLAEIYSKQGRTADAIVEYRRVLAIKPDNAEARAALESARLANPDLKIRN